jgi:hypothetical protein
VGAIRTGDDNIIDVCKQDYERAIGMLRDEDTSICIETLEPEFLQGSIKLSVWKLG